MIDDALAIMAYAQVSKEVIAGRNEEQSGQRVIPVAPEGPLNTWDLEDAKCCGKGLAKGITPELKEWTCPKCGDTWKPEQIGAVRHWRVHPWIATI